MTMSDKQINSAWWALRIGLGLGPFLAGLDKFFNLLTTWQMYLSPLAERPATCERNHFHAYGWGCRNDCRTRDFDSLDSNWQLRRHGLARHDRSQPGLHGPIL